MPDRYQEMFAAYATADLAIPPETAHEVKRRIIDSFGVMCAALDGPAPRIARTYAESYPLAEGASIFGSAIRTAPEFAAFANGVHVRYLDFNDTYLSLEPLHPSDTIPPLLALAEFQGLDGAALIASIAVAYEISMNLCDAASLRATGWDHTNYIGLAVAAGAARLLKLDRAQAANALSMAIVPHAAMRQTRSGELSMWKGAAAANSARSGLMGALLAARGFTGPFEPFTGERGMFAQMLNGVRFKDAALATIAAGESPRRICDAYIKAYPLEYHAQSAVDAAQRLHAQVGDWQAIEQIGIETFRAAYEIIAADPEKWHPSTRETADHSLQYIVAVALLDGRVTLDSFSPAYLADPRVRELLGRTQLVNSPRLSEMYPESIPNRITVRTKNGATYTEEERYPLGHAGNKMTDDEVVAKFRQNSAGVLSDAEGNALVKAIWNLEQLASIRELTAHWPHQE